MRGSSILSVLPVVYRGTFLKGRRFSSSSSCCGGVRVRFAPSPTGFLHLGGFRTALFNYLFALKTDGKFILRIEDTDQTRLVPEALKLIQEDLSWLGINPHEGPLSSGHYGPYTQSERLSIYQENLGSLIDSGHAYECFCTEKRLELMKREAAKLRQKSRYDNKCRDLTRAEVGRKKASGEKYCIRFKLEPEIVKFQDLVYGVAEFDLTGMSYEGDPVIVKSDGYPTYHYANVVDDHFMEISHVFRGVEWQVSTPKHLQMYRAFGWEPPKYAHLPLVLNKDGSKLSKRQGDISITFYRNQTYYPIALTNFVTKSGGGFSYHGVDKICSMKELAENMDISSVHAGGCRLDFMLLEKLNQLELKGQVETNLPTAVSTLTNVIKSSSKLEVDKYSKDYLEKVLRWSPERISKIYDLVSPDFEYLWSRPNTSLLSQVTISPFVLQELLNLCQNKLDDSLISDSKALSLMLEGFSKTNQLKLKLFLKDLRIILCGITKGPPIVEIFQLLGKQLVCDRLLNCVECLNSTTSSTLKQSNTV